MADGEFERVDGGLDELVPVLNFRTERGNFDEGVGAREDGVGDA